MSIERDPDLEPTVEMPRPVVPQVEETLEDIDPEQTLVREDWESTVIRRVAPHVAAVQNEVDDESEGEDRFGWESEGLRRLSRELQRVDGNSDNA
jgi:hypothetical protein